jgi:molybdate transport system ATP-binding protein
MRTEAQQQRDTSGALRRTTDGHGLSCVVQQNWPGLQLDIAFTANAPWTVLFGPSGSGKTTVLRAITGLQRSGATHVALDGRVLSDAKQRIHIPPYLRGVTLAGQEPALFPHRTVRQNVLYGMGHRESRNTSAPRGKIGPSLPARMDGPAQIGGREHIDGLGQMKIEDLLAQFHIEALADRKPGTLSGGERRRVALARAIARSGTRLLLLDEVFTGLEMALRDDLIATMLGWQRQTGVPVLSVTHDVGEALLLGAEVLRLHDGQVVEQGPARDVLAQERQRQIDLLS